MMHAGEQLKNYVIVRHIGAGGMADVFLAEKLGVGGFSRKVALKLIKDSLVKEDPNAIASFIDEARLGGSLTHPHILSTLDCGQFEDRVFIAMEYVEGPTLFEMQKALRRLKRTFPLPEAIEILRQTAEGLASAHDAKSANGTPLKMVHRDIKPSNILLTRHGQVKIADFGVAKAELREVKTQHSGVAKGTVVFMSPEQALGLRNLDGRSDLFSLSALFFELLAGKRLYSGNAYFQLIRSAQDAAYGDLNERLPKMPFRADILNILKMGLAKDKEERFDNAYALIESLEHLQNKLPRPKIKALIDELWADVENHRQKFQQQPPQLKQNLLKEKSPQNSPGAKSPKEASRRIARPSLKQTVLSILMGTITLAFLAFLLRPSTPAPTHSTPPPIETKSTPSPRPLFLKTSPTPQPPSPTQTTKATPKPSKNPIKNKDSEPPGFLSVNALGGGIIYVDGKNIGTQRLMRQPLSPGIHSLKITWGSKTSVPQEVKIISRRDKHCFARPEVDAIIECE